MQSNIALKECNGYQFRGGGDIWMVGRFLNPPLGITLEQQLNYIKTHAHFIVKLTIK